MHSTVTSLYFDVKKEIEAKLEKYQIVPNILFAESFTIDLNIYRVKSRKSYHNITVLTKGEGCQY